MTWAVWIMVAYILGAVPFGLVVAQIFCKTDPRLRGSKNTGSTNVARLCGFKYGVLVLLCDVLKGFLPVVIAMQFSHSSWLIGLTGLVAILGHCFSVFLGGKGGKAVATTLGVFLALAPRVTLIAAILTAGVIHLSGYVSVGSLFLVTVLPVLLLFSGHWVYTVYALLILMLVYWRHKENIIRLAKGEEKPWKKT